MELHNLASPGCLEMTNLFGATDYVFRAFRALWWRSVPWWRSTNEVLIVRLTPERFSAPATACHVPSNTAVTIATTPPFSRRASAHLSVSIKGLRESPSTNKGESEGFPGDLGTALE